MADNKLINTLKDIGLGGNEARVYFAALSLGPSTILKISRVAEIKRTTVYSVVEELKKIGLMNISVRGFKKLYVAEDPEKLEAILERRRNELKKNLPEFAALYNLKGGEGFIKYYEGLEAVKNIYENLIANIKPHQDYNVIADAKKWLELDQKYFRGFLEKRSKLNINTRTIIENNEAGQELKKFAKNHNLKVKLLPHETKLDIDIITTPQRIVFHQLIPPIMAIVVENQSLIRAHQQIFNIMWSSIKE